MPDTGFMPELLTNTEWASDKVVHAGGYLCLFILGVSAYGSRPPILRDLGIFLAAVGHGALAELAQTWIPSRQGDFFDLLADLVGITIGFCLVAWFRRSPRVE